MYFGDYRLSKTCLDHSLKELIPSAKSRRARGAFQQPAFMSDCLTISHTCLPSLLGKGTLVYKRCLLVVEGGEVGSEMWQSGEFGGWERCVSWMRFQWRERCVSGVRWHNEKGGRIVRWHGQRGRNVMR